MHFHDRHAEEEHEHQPARQRDPNDTPGNMDTLGVIILDAAFWAYCAMLLKLGAVLKDLEYLFFSCRCHPHRVKHWRRADESEHVFSYASTPIRGQAKHARLGIGRLADLDGQW